MSCLYMSVCYTQNLNILVNFRRIWYLHIICTHVIQIPSYYICNLHIFANLYLGTKISTLKCKYACIWRMHAYSVSTCVIYTWYGVLCLVGSIKLYVSFAKEPYKRDNILQKRPVILSILLTEATPYFLVDEHNNVHICILFHLGTKIGDLNTCTVIHIIHVCVCILHVFDIHLLMYTNIYIFAYLHLGEEIGASHR